MFGVLIPGRLVDAAPVAVDATRFMFTVPAWRDVNYVSVFLTGVAPLAEGVGASIFLCWQQPDGSSSWNYLGCITNEKPSALFRISKLKPQAAQDANPFMGMEGMHPAASADVAQIGVSLEPLAAIAQVTPETQVTAPTVSEFVQFSQYVVENLYNFIASFAVRPEQAAALPQDTWFPIGCLNRWHEQFLSKMERDPRFWSK